MVLLKSHIILRNYESEKLLLGYGDKYSMRPENWGRSLIKTSAKLQGVEFTNLDFEDVIDNAPDGAFLFVDPPYFNADQDKFYTFSFKKEDHYRLEQCLLRNKGRLSFLITYDNSPEIRSYILGLMRC